MIDTDKYEGHLNVYGFTFCSDTYQIMEEEGDTERFNPTVALLKDAPLILAAYKRLREELRSTQSNFSMVRNALANQYPEIEEAIWKVIE